MLLLAYGGSGNSLPPALREHESPTHGTSTMPYSLGGPQLSCELQVAQVESDPTLLRRFVRAGMVKMLMWRRSGRCSGADTVVG